MLKAKLPTNDDVVDFAGNLKGNSVAATDL